MDRRTSRQVELFVIVLVGLTGFFPCLFIAGLVAADKWTALTAAMIGAGVFGCVIVPLYLAWIIWFIVRGTSRRASPD